VAQYEKEKDQQKGGRNISFGLVALTEPEKTGVYYFAEKKKSILFLRVTTETGKGGKRRK